MPPITRTTTSDRVCASALLSSLLFFFNDTATTEIYTLSLHDALPIFARHVAMYLCKQRLKCSFPELGRAFGNREDRKSTRLNSSHANISYAVFCLKKKNKRDYVSDVDFTDSKRAQT